MLKGRMNKAEKGLWKCGTVMGRKVHIEVKNRVSEKTPCDGRTKEGKNGQKEERKKERKKNKMKEEGTRKKGRKKVQPPAGGSTSLRKATTISRYRGLLKTLNLTSSHACSRARMLKIFCAPPTSTQ